MFETTKRSALLLSAILGAFATSPAAAQEFRVYTRIYNHTPREDDDGQNEGPDLVARSLSLFHAGRVYDYIDTIGEVIVFDPAARKFRILNASRTLATEVDFDRVRQLVAASRRATEAYLDRLVDRGEPSSRKTAEAIRFQLEPRFEERYDGRTHRLSLTSPAFTYSARCDAGRVPEAVESYLRYADWMARLNHVLHPQALFPASRLVLNERLRRRKMLPVDVELRIETKPPVVLEAKHAIDWELDAGDRRRIRQWEMLLENPNVKHVDFREYQRAVLNARR